MVAAKCFDRRRIKTHNKTMTESMPSDDRKVQLRLHLQASDDLRELVGENLILPELRREFARRIFYLELATPAPVEVHLNTRYAGQGGVHDDEIIRNYTRTIEDVSSKTHMYVRPLRLAPEVGYAEREGRGASLRFRLALTALEASQLLAPPFDAVERHHAYALAGLRSEALVPTEERAAAVEQIRRELGVYNPLARRTGLALDHRHYYYLNRPAIRRQLVDPRVDE